MKRYVIGLRGGNNNDIFVARYYKKYNLSHLLKIAPLDFVLAKDVWYNVRVQILGFRMNVFLDEEQFPRVSFADHGTPLTTGRIALGGGWNPVEFDHVQVKSVQQHIFSSSALLYNFQNLEDPPLDGYVSVDGSQFNNSIGFGFNRLTDCASPIKTEIRQVILCTIRLSVYIWAVPVSFSNFQTMTIL
mmetsp:Transcript_24095/g.56980  ORF Transcript_24095/g.56980 Transcript_24095/m.56980 type:complete len:188 (-) Transcript_24095:665-1228(-)